MDVCTAVGAVLELARLCVTDRLPHVHRDGAGLRVRHQAARTEDPAELADVSHLVGRGDRDVEVGESLLDPLGEIGGADDVCAGLLGLLRLVALGEDGDLRVLAGSVRKHQRPAELLVRVADVQSQPEVDLDRLVELRRRHLLDDADSLRGRVLVLALEERLRVPVVLAVRHQSTSVSTPMDWAVPAMMRIAWSTSRAFRSGILVSAIWRTCALVRRPIFSRFGSPEPFSTRSASLIRTAAGGVFVMNEKERSS